MPRLSMIYIEKVRSSMSRLSMNYIEKVRSSMSRLSMKLHSWNIFATPK